MFSGPAEQYNGLTRVKAFLPDFIANTDRILNDPSLRASHQMNIQINDQADKPFNNDEGLP